MPRRSDIWRIGIVQAPIEALGAGPVDARVHWLPEQPSFTFLADPFGVWRDGRLILFAEAFDYRSRHGVIDMLTLDERFGVAERRTVLREPWHLSYPYLFEVEGQLWMAPEAFRSGRLTLYRQGATLADWTPAATLELDGPAIDPTIFRHDGLWWIAYSPARDKAGRQERLHLAYAEAVEGPWRLHAGNPVRIDRRGGRPGGTPFLHQGQLVLPVQDCSRTYGGAVRLLRIQALSPDRFEAELGEPIVAPGSAAPYRDGLHTLSACGDVCLIDVKRIDRSPRGLAIDALRLLRRRSP